MSSLDLERKSDYYFFYFNIWNRSNRIKIMSDSESEIIQVIPSIIENLKLIDKNKAKIALKIFEGRYSGDSQYQEDLLEEVTNATFQHFIKGLYISNVRIELYNNMKFDVIFDVRSKYRLRIDFGEECVLYFDHSFEV